MNKVITAREEAVARDSKLYNDSFLDAFHNPMLEWNAPWYDDRLSGVTPVSAGEIRELVASGLLPM